MKCANPGCGRWTENLHEGTLRLVERTVKPEDRVSGGDGGFPVCIVESRYFWLCQDCSLGYLIRGWSGEELLLEPRMASCETETQATVKALPRRRPISRVQFAVVQSGLA